MTKNNGKIVFLIIAIFVFILYLPSNPIIEDNNIIIYHYIHFFTHPLT